MTEETKRKVSESLKKYWQDKKVKDRKIRKYYAGLNIKPFYRLSKKEQQAKQEHLKKMVEAFKQGCLFYKLENNLL